ncbi:MAG: Phosphoesterase family, partial [Acidobacteriota bacterium]
MHLCGGAVIATLVLAGTFVDPAAPEASPQARTGGDRIHHVRVIPAPASPHLDAFRAKIQHIVFIVKENRSFDTYFGTFPGADGA